MLKLLFISNNPLRPSFRQRIEIFLVPLRQKGIVPEVNKLPKCYFRRWGLFRRSTYFDAVLLHKKCLNLTDAFLLRRYAKKIIYDFDDAVMFKPTDPYNEHTSHRRLFERTVKLADCIIAGNEYLASHARRYNRNVHIIPTGLALDHYKTDTVRPNDEKIRLVWVGSTSTLKYLEKIRPALEEVGRKFNNVRLRIICDSFFELNNMSVEKHLWSLDAEAGDLAECDIGLAPLDDNRFTRGKCGYKILQYMAAGLPIIASPVGTNHEYIEKSGAGLFAKDAEQWTEKLTTLIEDTQLRSELSTAGKEFVKQFDVSLLGNKLISVIKACAGDT